MVERCAVCGVDLMKDEVTICNSPTCAMEVAAAARDLEEV